MVGDWYQLGESEGCSDGQGCSGGPWSAPAHLAV